MSTRITIPASVFASPEYYDEENPLSWAAIVAAAGNYLYGDSEGYGITTITCGTDRDKFYELSRGLAIFPLSAISGKTIISAKIRLLGNYKADDLNAKPSTNIYSASPASHTELVASDYSKVGSTPLSTAAAYDDWPLFDWVEFELNADGLALLTGDYACFAMRNANYDVAGVESPWVQEQHCYVGWDTPQLVVTVESTTTGSGTKEDPYVIHDVDGLQDMQNELGDYWSVYYELGENIDASATSGWNSGQGFSPVGNLTTPFAGHFDGNDYTITGLFISRNQQGVGLFGAASSATFANVKLADCNITNLDDYTGALGGYFEDCSVTKCHSTGSVTSKNANYVGGLVGYTTRATLRTTLDKCDSSCAVTQTGHKTYYASGLVGYADYTDITKSFSAGSVEAQYQAAGGLVGYLGANATITDSYSSADVTESGEWGLEYSGGLVGYNSGTIQTSYSRGKIGGSARVGGLVGINDGGTVTDSFWDKETSGQETSDGGTGKTTGDMKKKRTFSDAGWDIYRSVMNPTNGYPFLGWQVGSSLTWLIKGLGGNPNIDQLIYQHAERMIR
jgi:hypothetical protein